MEGLVAGEDGETAHEGLGDEHSIEWVFVEELELFGREGVGLSQGKTRDARLLADRWDQGGGMRGQRELPLIVFAGHFPNGSRTEENLIRWVVDEEASVFREG